MTDVRYNWFLRREENFRRNVKLAYNDLNDIKTVCNRADSESVSTETMQTVDNILLACEDMVRTPYPWKRKDQKEIFAFINEIVDKVGMASSRKEDYTVRGYLAIALKCMNAFTAKPRIDIEAFETEMSVAPELAKLSGVRTELLGVEKKITRLNSDIINKKDEKEAVYRRFEKYPDGLPAAVENMMKADIDRIDLKLDELEDTLGSLEQRKDILLVEYERNREITAAYEGLISYIDVVGRFKITKIGGRTYDDIMREYQKIKEREMDELERIRERARERRNGNDNTREDIRREYSEERTARSGNTEFDKRKQAFYNQNIDPAYFDVKNDPANRSNYARV